jgi:hypothetical protein
MLSNFCINNDIPIQHFFKACQNSSIDRFQANNILVKTLSVFIHRLISSSIVAMLAKFQKFSTENVLLVLSAIRPSFIDVVKGSEHRKNRTVLDSFCASNAVNFTAWELQVVNKHSMMFLWFHENSRFEWQRRGDSNGFEVVFDVFGLARFHFRCGIEAICEAIEWKTSAVLQTNSTTFSGGTKKAAKT